MSSVDILVSHVDLDGYGCEIVSKKYLNYYGVYHVNYDELASTLCDIRRDCHLFITDLSIPENLAGLIEEFEDVTIIDHHISTFWAHDRWKSSPRIDVKISKERCATYLFGQWLMDKGFATRCEWLCSWMDLVDDYDRYVLQYPESERLNALLYTSNRERFVSEARDNTPMKMLEVYKDKIDQYLKNQADYVESTYYQTYHDDDGQSIAIVFAERYKSKIAQRIFQTENVDVVYILDLRTRQCSIRSTPESRIDCSKLAQHINPEGGGHHNASGFELPKEALDMKFLKDLWDAPFADMPRYEED